MNETKVETGNSPRVANGKMSEQVNQESTLRELLDRMVAAKQLSSADAATLAVQGRADSKVSVQNEEEVHRWLPAENEIGYRTLEEIEPERELSTNIPATVLP